MDDGRAEKGAENERRWRRRKDPMREVVGMGCRRREGRGVSWKEDEDEVVRVEKVLQVEERRSAESRRVDRVSGGLAKRLRTGRDGS